jgi:hypothetical protein
VVVDERQVDLGPLGDGAGSGAAVAALDKHVACGVEDTKACRLPASRSSVGSGGASVQEVRVSTSVTTVAYLALFFAFPVS